MESTALFKLAVTTRGDALRTAAWDAVYLFPIMVLGPHRPRAPSSAVKAETELRLDLGHHNDLQELANRAMTARLARPANTRSKKTKKALRAVTLLRHNQCARAAGLAESKGVADATPGTLKALPSLFKDPGVVEEATLRRLYGPEVPPTRATTAVNITVKMV